ncbi:MAG: shikimate kinase [Acidimicrobiales bacterium]|jgi:shikimate kinase
MVLMGRNVILTGFMGTGKTTVGRAVAGLLGHRFIDTDQIIIERHGPIPEIFERQGEAGFRRYESDVAAELAGQSDLVISTGGRLMLDDGNARALETTGDVFCLHASLDEILRRVLADHDGPTRPLLAGDDPQARVRNLLAERAAGYARFRRVETDGRPPHHIAAEIVGLLQPQQEK